MFIGIILCFIGIVLIVICLAEIMLVRDRDYLGITMGFGLSLMGIGNIFPNDILGYTGAVVFIVGFIFDRRRKRDGKKKV